MNRADRGRGWCALRRQLAHERGAATAETAIIMVAVAALLMLLLGTGTVVVQQVQLTEGTRTVAREVMRGVPPDEAVRSGMRVAGYGATFAVAREGDLVRVEGRRQARIIGPMTPHALTLRAESTARVEPHLLMGSSP